MSIKDIMTLTRKVKKNPQKYMRQADELTQNMKDNTRFFKQQYNEFISGWDPNTQTQDDLKKKELWAKLYGCILRMEKYQMELEKGKVSLSDIPKVTQVQNDIIKYAKEIDKIDGIE